METKIILQKLTTEELVYLKMEIESILISRESVNLIKLEDCKLSARAFNILSINGIKYLNELTRMSSNECLKFPNLGRKSITELSENLEENGIWWRT